MKFLFGEIRCFDRKKNSGFIVCDSVPKDIFFSPNSIPNADIFPGQLIQFKYDYHKNLAYSINPEPTSTYLPQRLNGTVYSYLKKTGYGFICHVEAMTLHHFHATALMGCKSVCKGDPVSFIKLTNGSATAVKKCGTLFRKVESMEKQKGIVRFYNEPKSYGFITTASRKSIFFHINHVKSELVPRKGDLAAFLVSPTIDDPTKIEAIEIKLYRSKD
jgi:cold shock CspA family protein